MVMEGCRGSPRTCQAGRGGCIFWAMDTTILYLRERALCPSGSGEAISPDQQVLERGIMGQPGKEIIAND